MWLCPSYHAAIATALVCLHRLQSTLTTLPGAASVAIFPQWGHLTGRQTMRTGTGVSWADLDIPLVLGRGLAMSLILVGLICFIVGCTVGFLFAAMLHVGGRSDGCDER